jgi:hypothetical protein
VHAPSIKGAAFQAVPADVDRLLEEGALSASELEARLTPDDIRILREEVTPGSWYPIGTYERLLDLLVEMEGGSQPEMYLLKRGVDAAKRIFAMGIYSHLEAAHRAVDRAPKNWCAQVGRIMMTLSNSMFSFSHREFVDHGDSKRLFSIYVSDAEFLPEATRILLQGFIEYVFNQFTDEPTQVKSRRSSPDSIVYEGVSPTGAGRAPIPLGS